MALIINHNMMAANAARNLGDIYGRLSTSVQRLSSGLRINSAADDAAGLAIREMMRADIATTKQGLRNAADAISMIQTADGALGVIDEKLTRMKELAEQASTGTYTDLQRDIINSEYQAMAKEIDRIANATNFNGIKLLDGSVAEGHQGRGMKVHFGTGNNAAEDYYFIKTGDARATTATGLMVGGDAKNDVWSQAAIASSDGSQSCCAGGSAGKFTSPNTVLSGGNFAFGYNWDLKEPDDADLSNGKYTAGIWNTSGKTLAQLVGEINQGTQARVGINIATTFTDVGAASAMVICIGDEAYRTVASNAGAADTLAGKSTMALGANTAVGLATKINASSKSFTAMASATTGVVYVFSKTGGAQGNGVLACERATSDVGAAGTNQVSFFNAGNSAQSDQKEMYFSLGGEMWGTAKVEGYNGTYGMTVSGKDAGKERDINIYDVTKTTGAIFGSTAYTWNGITKDTDSGLKKNSFVEIQNADDAKWKGADVRSQSAAQESLAALDAAITKKDKIRADLGAMQNRLENTMTNLTIQAENLQASESRISDVDVATEMTEFTRNNILSQAATSMLAQANSISQLALSLIR